MTEIRIGNFNSYDRLADKQSVFSIEINGGSIDTFNGTDVISRDVKCLGYSKTNINSFKYCEQLPPNLHYLGLEYSKISNFDYCENLPRTIRELSMEGCPMNSFEGCKGLPPIETLSISTESLKGIKCLPSSLRTLTIVCDEIHSFEDLKDVPISLNRLEIRTKNIKNFKGFSLLPKTITQLSIVLDSNENTLSFEGSEELHRDLKYLDIQVKCCIKDISGVESLPLNLGYFNIGSPTTKRDRSLYIGDEIRENPKYGNDTNTFIKLLREKYSAFDQMNFDCGWQSKSIYNNNVYKYIQLTKTLKSF